MKNNFTILIISAIFIAGCANRALKRAEVLYQNEQYVSAAKSYETFLSEHPDENDAKAMLRLADCYRQMNRYADAETWYAKAIDSPKATNADRLHYAEVLKAQGKCELAKEMIDRYLVTAPADNVARNMRVSCEKPFESADSFYSVERVNLGFSGSCYSPVKSGNDLLVTASPAVKPGAPVDNWTGRGFFDLYIVSMRDKNVPLKTGMNSLEGTNSATASNGPNADDAANDVTITPLGALTTDYHEGVPVISPDGKELYYTRSKMKTSSEPMMTIEELNPLEICVAKMVDGKWANPKALPFNDNKEYSVGHPALTADGQRMYFISDRPDGFGGTDIYYADRKDSTWGKPVNAGGSVNTSGDEMFPSIHKFTDGKEVLYFSSDGHAGDGGLDIFFTILKDKTPGTVTRSLAPINSSYDDFGLVYNDDERSGYLSSNRGNTEGRDEIYAFKRKANFFYVKADVLFKGSEQPVGDIKVEVVNAKTGKVDSMITDSTGGIFFEADSMTTYSFAVRKEGFFTAVGAVDIEGFHGKLRDTAHVKLYMDEIVINKPIRLENIYYDFDKWNIRPDAATELDKLVRVMKDNPRIKIELGSHTDCRGSDKYNDRLSQRRAESAVSYIISKGISADRITAHGYGESVLLNKCDDGVECTEQEHQWNRRTEFKVTEMTAQ
jgi:outer membrane protein OmpA-like peptidoglycan-associated protein